MPKHLSKEQLLGERGVNLIAEKVYAMGFAWQATNQALDVGIDGWIELRDRSTGAMSGSRLFVQSKARTKLERETETSFEFTCTREDLEYWLSGSAPVLLIVSKPSSAEAWWVSVKDYFQPAERRQSRRIHFEKAETVFDESAADRLIALSARAGAGAYFRPPPKYEYLISNLLKVTRFPPKLFRAVTELRDREDVRKEMRARGVKWPDTEFTLNNGLILSVHDLRNEPWRYVCDPGTIEGIEIEEYRDSNDRDLQRQFTHLLNLCLARRVSIMGMHYIQNDGIHYFKASKPPEDDSGHAQEQKVLPSRRRSYKSRKSEASREVFGAHFAKKDSTQVAYYRHVGFERQFVRIVGEWYLQITPTYHYTIDGHTPHPFREEYLAGIKRREGNNAVAGTVVMFESLLQDDSGLFRDIYPFLGFGKLARLEISVGIEDSAWRKQDEMQPVAADGEGAVLETALFDDEG